MLSDSTVRKTQPLIWLQSVDQLKPHGNKHDSAMASSYGLMIQAYPIPESLCRNCRNGNEAECHVQEEAEWQRGKDGIYKVCGSRNPVNFRCKYKKSKYP